MNVSTILSRAWSIAWGHKSLWWLYLLPNLILLLVFGAVAVVVALASGLSFVDLARTGRTPNFADVGGPFFAFICLYLVFILVAIVMGIIVQAGIIAGVNQAESEGSTSFGRAWSAGAARFWPMLGLGFLFMLVFFAVFIVITIITGGFSMLTSLGSAAAFGGPGSDASGAQIATALAGSLATQLGFQCISTIIFALLGVIFLLSAQGIVVDGIGVFDSVGRAFGIVKNYLGSVIALMLLILLISWLIALVIGVIALVFFLVVGGGAALLGSSRESAQLAGGGLGIALACGIPLFVVLSLVLGTVIQIFQSAVWTLAYRQATHKNSQLPPPPSSPYTPIFPN